MADARLVIKLDENDIDAIAHRVAELLATTPRNSNPSDPGAARSDQFSQEGSVSPEKSDDPVDPWAAQPAPSEASAPAQAEAKPSAPTESPVPSCDHGPMIRRPAGIYKSGPKTGQPYGPFYACPQPRNAPDKCRSVNVGQ